MKKKRTWMLLVVLVAIAAACGVENTDGAAGGADPSADVTAQSTSEGDEESDEQSGGDDAGNAAGAETSAAEDGESGEDNTEAPVETDEPVGDEPAGDRPASGGDQDIKEIDAWELVAEVGFNVNDIAATPTGFVAIGSEARRSPAVWTSADGADWSQASIDVGEVVFLDSVLTTPRGVLVAGGNLVWESSDGEAWTAPTELGPAATDDAPGTDVGGLAEFGDVVYAGGVTVDVATVWRSDAAGSWSVAATEFGDPGREEEIRQLAAGPAGLVAVGHGEPRTDAPLEQRRPLIWHSPDGSNWTEVNLEGDFEGRGGILKTVVWSEKLGAYFAAGWDGVSEQEQRAIVFTSTDGVTWQQIVDPGLDTTGVDEKLHGIVATEAGLMAGGSDEYSNDPNPFGILWFSPDGRTWVPGSFVADEAWINAIAPLGDGLCLAGGNGNAGGSIWRGPCDGLFTQ